MWNRKWENTEQYQQKKFWICFRNLRFNKFQLQCPAIWGWPELRRGVRKVLLRQLWALASFQWRVSGPFLFIPGQLIDLCGKRGFMSSSSDSGPNFLYGQLTYRLLWAWHWPWLPNAVWPVRLGTDTRRRRRWTRWISSGCTRRGCGRPVLKTSESPGWPLSILRIGDMISGSSLLAVFNVNSPNANPSLVHCTWPPTFWTSQRSTASEPSSTVMSCGFVRNFCCESCPLHCARTGMETRKRQICIN